MSRYLAVSWMGEPRRFLVVDLDDRFRRVVAEAGSFDMADAIAKALSPPERDETDSGVSSAEPTAQRPVTGQPVADPSLLAARPDIVGGRTDEEEAAFLRSLVASGGYCTPTGDGFCVLCGGREPCCCDDFGNFCSHRTEAF